MVYLRAMKENQNDILKKIAESEYEQGFVTDLEQEVFSERAGRKRYQADILQKRRTRMAA